MRMLNKAKLSSMNLSKLMTNNHNNISCYIKQRKPIVKVITPSNTSNVRYACVLNSSGLGKIGTELQRDILKYSTSADIIPSP